MTSQMTRFLSMLFKYLLLTPRCAKRHLTRPASRAPRDHLDSPRPLTRRGAITSRHPLDASDWGNLQQINGLDAHAGLDPGRGHLRPAARRGAQVHHDCSRPQKLLLVVYFEKLERRAGAIALLPGLAHVRIGDMAAQPLFVRLRHAPLPA